MKWLSEAQLQKLFLAKQSSAMFSELVKCRLASRVALSKKEIDIPTVTYNGTHTPEVLRTAFEVWLENRNAHDVKELLQLCLHYELAPPGEKLVDIYQKIPKECEFLFLKVCMPMLPLLAENISHFAIFKQHEDWGRFTKTQYRKHMKWLMLKDEKEMLINSLNAVPASFKKEALTYIRDEMPFFLNMQELMRVRSGNVPNVEHVLQQLRAIYLSDEQDILTYLSGMDKNKEDEFLAFLKPSVLTKILKTQGSHKGKVWIPLQAALIHGEAQGIEYFLEQAMDPKAVFGENWWQDWAPKIPVEMLKKFLNSQIESAQTNADLWDAIAIWIAAANRFMDKPLSEELVEPIFQLQEAMNWDRSLHKDFASVINVLKYRLHPSVYMYFHATDYRPSQKEQPFSLYLTLKRRYLLYKGLEKWKRSR